jgi:hypothetical protein
MYGRSIVQRLQIAPMIKLVFNYQYWVMHRCQNRPYRFMAIYLIAIIIMVSTVQASDEFRIRQVRTWLYETVYRLDADIDYVFAAPALEALDNGVPLTLLVQIQVRPRKAWIWEESVTDQRLRYQIRYKPLSESYLVTQLPSHQGRSYVSRQAAIDALGELKNIALVDQQQLQTQTDYVVKMRATLDIEELPLPLRPVAYLHPSWQQASDWTQWPLQP